MTRQLQTNHDLSRAIHDLLLQQQNCDRSLESYLLGILSQSAMFETRDSLTLTEFYELIAAGFTCQPAEFDETWRDQYDQLPHQDNGYDGWQATVIRQIVDLREMDECGMLANDMRFFGLSAPRNSSWYNFDPLGYLECATAGSIDRRELPDVPLPVEVQADNQSITTADSEDPSDSIRDLTVVPWDEFKAFAICGQIYE